LACIAGESGSSLKEGAGGEASVDAGAGVGGIDWVMPNYTGWCFFLRSLLPPDAVRREFPRFARHAEKREKPRPDAAPAIRFFCVVVMMNGLKAARDFSR
jgi:hypothetical protein